MQKLIFKRLIIKGFGSIQDEIELNLNNRKLNLIKGVNGTGKSSIINSFFWCLYGETLKDKSSVELWKNLRDDKYRGVYVELTFKRGKNTYRIIRMKNWSGKIEGARGSSRLLLYTNNNLYQIEDKREIQKYLVELLGINSAVLKNSVVFGQKVSRITQEKGVKRKEILDKLFDLAYINNAKDKAQFDLNEINERVNELNGQSVSAEKYLELLKSGLEKNRKFNREASDNLKRELKINKSDIRKAKLKYKQYQDELSKITIPKSFKSKEFKTIKFDNKILTKLYIDYGINEAALDQSILDLSELRDNCPVCSKPFNKQMINTSRNSFTSERERLKLEKTRLSDLIKAEEKVKEKVDKDNFRIKQDRKENDDKVKDLERKREGEKRRKISKERDVSESKKTIDRFKNETPKIAKRYSMIDTTDVEKKIEDVNVTLDRVNRKIIKLDKKADRLKWLVDDALSNKGLKAFIFSHLLDSINDKLLEYESVSGFELRFEVGTNAKRDINIRVIKNGFEVNIADLSGGQKQLLDIISIFAIHDVLQQDLKVTTLFLDEVFESLSEDNVEKVDELINLIT